MRSSCFPLRSRRLAVSIAALFALAALPTMAWGQQAAETAEYSLRTYDVGDLVLNVPDYPYPSDTVGLNRFGAPGGIPGGPGGFGGGGGGFGATTTGSMGGMTARVSQRQVTESVSAGITMDDILRVVINVVAPPAWSDNGGEGEIQRLGTSLVVWQTAAVHEHIRDLLGQLRAESGERKTVSIDARWLLLNSDELDEMLLSEASPAEVDREVLETYTRRPANIRGVTNCFSGQLVYIVGGTRRNHVSGQIPVVGSGVGYQPIIEKTNFGALLQIRPTVMKGGQEAVVNVISTVSAPGVTVRSDQDAGGYGVASPMVDRVAIEIQELATTFRVPLGKPVLVGGLTYRPNTDRSDAQPAGPVGESQEAAGENSQLYLILELR